METRSFQSGNGCHLARLVKENGVRFPSILNNNKNAEESPDRPGERNDFDCTNKAGTTLALQVAKVIKTIIISHFFEERSFQKLIGSESSISTKQDPDISCEDHYRSQLPHTSILQQASTLISSLRRQNYILNQQLSWKK